MSRNALGKGLSALIREPEAEPQRPVQDKPSSPPSEAAGESVLLIDLDRIEQSPYQPRSRFDSQGLDDLAASIRVSGIIQPLLVRNHGGRFQLIAGERRWRAAQRAGLQKIPVVVREVSEQQALEMALVENLQREDLNPIEQATAFDRLVRQFQFTQEDVAKRTGKDRATVANALRLLRLEKPIQEMLEFGKITASHARALLGVEDPSLRLRLAQRASIGSITVRQLERHATRKRADGKKSRAAELDANMRAAIDELQRILGTRVYLRPKSPRVPGLLSIEFYDDKNLMDLYERLIKH
jgi:ParB family chromosome partitioning protein